MAILRVLLTLSAVLACALTFLWPFAVSADPADPAFRAIAIATLVVFLASLAALAALRLRATH